ncbi:pyridoxamine 5'-phosphate oxidase family protein [Hwanghaeella grinnelliae]|uniref:Pyridoxamine 5'-phosphate oxidase family protein n=1 Tax=Hwanghaeella grinnelliae TaxID=2500179 RepID=A0A437QPJ2_9PROT|nr:pyridoxamine 5'-phosphate oxidase family protein [Hwanghaeella grinnelliae]RVU36377.1 pyridoxamine 5'-phosphate oxidase family protein [Hwanghaeella grinnelliae]
MTDTTFPITGRNKVKRAPLRGAYDKASVYAVLDECRICHVGYVVDGQPYVTPTLFWRDGNTLYWHGSSASRMLRTVKTGVNVCVTASLFDGWVMARSGFHHSANYRSVMAYGTARALATEAEKDAALKVMMDGLFPGRWEEIRPSTTQELKATTVVSMDIEQASAKIRCGGPIDDDADYDLPVWAGVLPVRQVQGAPVPDPKMTDGIEFPENLSAYLAE